MKYNLTLIVILALLFISCSKDKAAAEIIPISNVCDSINPVSFMNDVEPILLASCYGCHSATVPVFSDYSSVFAVKDDILKAIQHDPSFSAMPQNGSKLADSLINEVQCWIESGAPNN
ncbi:MAG: hypothetical protein P8M12_04665 [Flavobacteriales bacterium]|jgi:hypothetical protein|nr:hypothetical protein [Flavobacteriales bacterium]